MKNHQSRSTGSTPFPEANRTSFHSNKGSHNRGRGRKNYKGKRKCTHNSYKRNANTRSGTILRLNKMKNKGLQNKPTNNYEDKCYRCGMKEYWSRTCRTPKYQASIKKKINIYIYIYI
jgi:hypothetical protein